MSSVRLRRLQADYQKVRDYVRRHPRLELIQTEGDPPERYQIQYRILSLRQKDDDLFDADTHLVEISLLRNYPRVPPQCRMLTPIFHPNVAPHAICIGDHWSAGEPLASIVARIGELIAYQSYNTKSPLNGEAARWTDENLDQLPLDAVSMVLDDSPRKTQPTSIPVAPAIAVRRKLKSDVPIAKPVPPPSAQPLTISCPNCRGPLLVRRENANRRLLCPHCQATFTGSSGPEG